MNEYKITYTGESEGYQLVTERTEAAAKKFFLSTRKGIKLDITSIELHRENASATKQQERDTLAAIRKMVEELGPQSYLATAFEGCFEDAEQNIEDDAGVSMKNRWEYAEQRPADTKGDTKKMQFKTRYFSSWTEAQRIMYVLQSLDITTERVRGSATQGEVKVFINGEYILNFGDKIVLPERGASPEDYYGDDIGGWRSSEPDSSFVLGLIWHPFDYVYHYSERICKALGVTQEEWIEGNYWNREGQIWKATEN